MNQQFLFNSSLALLSAAMILLLKGIILLGLAILILAIVISIVWLMSGFFGKFEYESSNSTVEDEKEEEGKGVLKPF